MYRKLIRDGIEIFPLVAFMALTKFLSLQKKALIGGCLIGLIIRANTNLRTRIMTNLELAMPEQSFPERKRFLQQVGKFIGVTFIELIFNSEFQQKKSRFRYSATELRPLVKAKKEGRPIIIVSAHFGPWEAIRAVLKMNNLTAGAIYKKNKNHLYEAIHLNAIKAGGEPIFPTGVVGTKKMVKYLKKGGIVAVMLDQAAIDGEFFDFLGVPAKTTTSIAKLALKLNALVVPSYAIRGKDQQTIDVYFETPVSNTDYQDMTFKLTKSIEQKVIEYPEQWYWLHQRWKY